MKKNIAILMGGYSSEYDISIKSGSIVAQNLDTELFEAYPVHINRESWFFLDSKGVKHLIDKSDFSLNTPQKVQFDVVFNAIHGIPGENGQILAYLELLGIPHTSAPFYQMALTFNKRDCLAVASKYGIPTAKSIFLNQGDPISPDKILEALDFPIFVKPNQAGSSFGISKVYTEDELIKGIYSAFKEDDQIILEEGLNGTEVSVGVISSPKGPMVLPTTEIVSENDFFDYEAKYLGKSQEITPARISEEERIAVSKMAVALYEKLKMSGFSRSEFIFVDGVPHFLEMNTVPGLTKESILPQQAAVAGISLTELFTLAINQAQSS